MEKTTDLGTYFLRIELEGGDGFIQEIKTGWRYTDGSGSSSPLSAHRIPPTWKDEQDLIDTMLYLYLEGNYSCDCNKTIFLQDAHQIKRDSIMDASIKCGDIMEIMRITLITPDQKEKMIYKNQ